MYSEIQLALGVKIKAGENLITGFTSDSLFESIGSDELRFRFTDLPSWKAHLRTIKRQKILEIENSLLTGYESTWRQILSRVNLPRCISNFSDSLTPSSIEVDWDNLFHENKSLTVYFSLRPVIIVAQLGGNQLLCTELAHLEKLKNEDAVPTFTIDLSHNLKIISYRAITT